MTACIPLATAILAPVTIVPALEVGLNGYFRKPSEYGAFMKLGHVAKVAPSREETTPHSHGRTNLLHPGNLFHVRPGILFALPRTAGAKTERVRFRRYEADHIALDVVAGGAGLLVLSEMYYPGWIATVNGKAAKIYPVDGALRGIHVSAGSNAIELEYAPSSFHTGAALSLLTLTCLAAGSVYVVRQARGQAGDRSSGRPNLPCW
jgi:hypothetical protein